MDGKLALIHVNMYIKNYIPYDGIFYQCIEPAISYMKNNPTDPESIYLNSFIEESKVSLHNILIQINNELLEKNITDSDVLDYYIRSKIPFKSKNQFFYLSLFCTYAGENPTNHNYFRTIYSFLLSDKFIGDNSLRNSLDRVLPEKYQYYDVWENKNGEDDVINNIILRNRYICGEYSVGLQLTDEQIGLIGYCAEQEFYNNALKNKDKDDIIIWVSRRVNKYEPLDFVIYNLRRKFARVHEIKGTVYKDVSQATITKEEEKVLDQLLQDSNCGYEVDRVKLDSNLKGVVDYTAFRIYSPGQLQMYNMDGTPKTGIGIVYGSNEETMIASNISLLFPGPLGDAGQSRIR